MESHIDQNGFVKMQPLRMSPGWSIEWFTFPDVDPSAATIDLFDSSSLLIAFHEGCHIQLDVAWKPEMDINGYFELNLHSYLKTFDETKNIWRIDVDWNNPALEFQTKSRAELIAKLEEVMRIPPCYEDPRFIKANGLLVQPAENLRLELVKHGPSLALAERIAKSQHKGIQLLLIAHKAISHHVLSAFIDMDGLQKGPKKKALDKLNSKVFRQ